VAEGTKDLLDIGTGTTLNEYLTSAPNRALDVIHGTSGNNSKPDTLTLQLKGTASGLLLKYASMDSAGAANTWSYSLDGSSFTQVATFTPDGTWRTYTVDFSGIPGAASTVYLRDSFNTAGTLSFDNISVSTVPEPTTCALPLFGLIFLGGSIRTFLLGRVRKAASGAPADC
jgi:hypothetical protein